MLSPASRLLAAESGSGLIPQKESSRLNTQRGDRAVSRYPPAPTAAMRAPPRTMWMVLEGVFGGEGEKQGGICSCLSG